MMNSRPPSRVFFWGAGGGGAAFLQNSGIVPLAFFDSDPSKWGTYHQGILVRPPRDLHGVPDATVYITTGEVPAVVDAILSLGVPRKQIVVPPSNQLGKQVLRDPRVRAEVLDAIDFLGRQLSNHGKLICVGGIALGLARSGDLIPWDVDADLAFPDTEVEIIRELVQGSSIRVSSCFQKRLVGDFELSNNRLFPFSIQFFNPDLTHYVDDQFNDKRWNWPIEMFTKPQPVQARGSKFWLPNPVEHYLSRVYGENWEVPDETFNYFGYGGE